jgi:hypothetical protein
LNDEWEGGICNEVAAAQSRNLSEGTEETHEKPVGIAYDPAELRTRLLPHTYKSTVLPLKQTNKQTNRKN